MRNWVRLLEISFVSFAFATSAFGQAASVTWNLTAPDSMHVSPPTGNITAQDQSLTNLYVQPGTNGYTSSGQRTSPRSGGVDGTWITDAAEEPTRYMEFTVAPTPTYDFLVSSISFYLSANSGSHMHANAYYSTDPSFGTRTQITTPSPLPSTAPGSPNITASPNITVSGGQTLYVRVYPWEDAATSGKYLVTKTVTISGTTSTAGPTIIPLVSSLPSFSQTVGSPSITQTYTVSGNSLTANVDVTPPVGFEISTNGGSTWGNNSSPLSLPVSGGNIVGQPVSITVRFNAASGGAYSGNIAHASTGATTANVSVSGFALSAQPTAQSSIAFGAVTGNSIMVSFTGGNGSNRIVVARLGAAVSFAPMDGNPVSGVSSNFASAADQGSGNRVVYDGTGTSVNVTSLSQNTIYHFAVYEYNVGAGNSQNYNTTFPGTGNDTTLAVPTLVVIPTSLAFGGVEINTTSIERTYALSGTTLTPASGNIIVTAPSGYQVSTTTDSGFASSVNVPYSAGALASTTIYAIFSPTSIVSYPGNITNAGGGATAENVGVTGTGIGPPQQNVLEAENGILNSAYVSSQYSGYSGVGYVDIANKTGASLEISFRRATASTDTVRVYYALGASSRAYAVTLNGAVVGSPSFTSTSSWTTWSSIPIVVPMQAGVNRLRFAATTNTSENANLDRIYIGGQAATPVYKLTLLKSGSGTVAASPASADSFYDAGTSVMLTAMPSGGSSFYRWSGTNQSSSNPYTIVMDSHQTEIGVMPVNPGFGAFPYESAPRGFAAVGAFTYPNGTTGGTGSGSQIVYVTNSDDFGNLLFRRTDVGHGLNFPPLIVYVIGTLTTGTVVTDMCDVKDAYDISIIGVGVDATLSGFGLNIVRSKNIIVRNLKIQNSPIDGITVQADDIDGTGNHLWFDHNTITNCYDGALDITHTASYATVSWNHFYNHNKLCLMGHSDSQTSDVTMKVTYHHNYFDSTEQRHPRVRYGKAHVANNYYRNIGLYGISSNDGADVLVEGNYFQNVPLPSDTSRDGSIPGDVLERNNIFVNCGAAQTRGTAFEASAYYGYSVDDPATIPAMVSSYAGSGKWDFSSSGSETPQPPGIPALASPANGTTGTSLSQAVVWRTNFNTTSYRIQLSTDSTFASSMIDSTLTDTSCVAAGLQNSTTYFWRVKGINAVGAGSFSLPWKFRTVSSPTSLALLSPSNLNFGNVLVNSSKQDTVKIRSAGVVALHVDSIRVHSGEFTATPTSSAVLPVGDSLMVTVTFGPTSVGAKSAYLVVYSDAPASPDSVHLSGLGTSTTSSINVSVGIGWNMLSNPVTTAMDSVRQLFPVSSLEYAFSFAASSGYQQEYRMQNGKGYWMKFSNAGIDTVEGTTRASDTIAVNAGWNMVGSVSLAVDTADIHSVPAGIIASPFYVYAAGYSQSAMIEPGLGYWVKVSSSGSLILSPSSSAAMARVRAGAKQRNLLLTK